MLLASYKEVPPWLVTSSKRRRDSCSGPPYGLNELTEVRFKFPFNLGGLTVSQS